MKDPNIFLLTPLIQLITQNKTSKDCQESEVSIIEQFSRHYFSSSKIPDALFYKFLKKCESDPELLEDLSNKVLNHEIVNTFNIRRQYQINFLKRLISQLEKSSIPIPDGIYDRLGELMGQKDEEEIEKVYLNKDSADFMLSINESANQLSKGTTGLSVWQASCDLANLCTILPLKNGKIVELGAGCGLSGISISVKNPDSTVYLTDYDANVIEMMKRNVSKNKLKNCNVFPIDWTHFECKDWKFGYDISFIIAADVVYDVSLLSDLCHTISVFLKSDPKLSSKESGEHQMAAIIACTLRNPESLETFEKEIAKSGLSIVEKIYYENGVFKFGNDNEEEVVFESIFPFSSTLETPSIFYNVQYIK